MKGPEHYRVAEALLGNLRQDMAGHPGHQIHTTDQQHRMIAEAQVHATLALVAATIEGAARGPGEIGRDWLEAIS